MIGRGTDHGVDRLLLVQHPAEVLVFAAAEVGRLTGEMPLNLRLDRLAPRQAPVVERLQVVSLDRVGHGDELGIGLLEQGPQVAAALAACADQSDIHLLAGGTSFGPPSTCRGTIEKAASPRADLPRNERRGIFMVVLVEASILQNK